MNENERRERVEAIFARAADLPEKDRPAFLARACGDDEQLGERVEKLLAVETRMAEFMSEPTVKLDEAPGSARLGEGAVIGPYKLLEQIGEGGFGVVYMAEQQTPVVRKVAFKIIKLGMDTRSVIARFEAERQALALMDHPNIAKVLDAGATDNGRPYFVMDLVRGIPITEFCDDNNLSTEERLNLFCDVCSAVQHAHQKGIIHRDLKPNNILVTMNGDQPLPKVIDFGIAKATQGRLTDKTLFTQFQQLIGTPAYMSPEQAQMSTVDVDTRSDIYSLGVLLYELLTGQPPFDPKDLLSGGFEEIRRRIREEDPPKPSTRVSTMTHAERTTVAKHRKAEPEKLGRLIRGELDWIVMKAMEKDRTRRYETANGLAMDVKRFLGNEIVTAVAPSTGYRLRKLARRNKAPFAAATAITASLILGLGLAIFSFSRERVARTEAEYRREEAENARNAEVEQRHIAEQNELRARHLRYASDMTVAQAAVRDGETEKALAILDSHVPTEDEPDIRGWQWRFLRGQLHQEREAVRTHKSISRTAVSPDGRWIAVAGNKPDGKITIEVLHADDLVIQQSIPLAGSWDGLMCSPRSDEPEGWVAGMRFSLDSTRLIVERNQNQGVLEFDLATGEQRRLAPRSTQQEVPVWPARLSPDGRWLVGMYETPDGQARYLRSFDVATDTEVAVSEPFFVWSLNYIDYTMRFSPDGDWIAVSCSDDIVRVLAVPGFEEVRVLQVRAEPATLAWSPDSRILAVACGFPLEVELWDFASGKSIQTLTGAQTWFMDLSFSPLGSQLAASTWGGQILVWDLENQVLRKTFQANAYPLAFAPEGDRLVSGGQNGLVELWDLSETKTELRQASEQNELWNAVFSPDGGKVATTSLNGVVRLFDTESEVLVRTFHPDAEPAGRLGDTAWAPLCFSPDGSRIVAGNGDQTATVYDARTGEPRMWLDSKVGPLIHLRYSPGGETLAATGEDNTLVLWDATTWEERRRIPGPRFINFSPIAESRLLAYRGKDSFSLLRLDTLETHTVENPEDIWSVAFSRDGAVLACGFTGEVRLYDVPSLEFHDALPVKRSPISDVAFTPDAQTLAIPVWFGYVSLWNRTINAEVGRAPLPADWIISAAFSPDGSTLAVSTRSNGVHLFRAPTFEQIAVWDREEERTSE